MSKEMDIPDEELLSAITRWGSSCMTYVIRNILCNSTARRGLKTSYVLRRLKKLEKEGKIERAKSSYMVQICWKLKEAAK